MRKQLSKAVRKGASAEAVAGVQEFKGTGEIMRKQLSKAVRKGASAEAVAGVREAGGALSLAARCRWRRCCGAGCVISRMGW